MRTRRENSFPAVGAQATTGRKRMRFPSVTRSSFDVLPDDIVLSVLVKLGSTADSPADFVASLSTFKRFNCLGLHPLVLSQASAETFAITATSWSPAAKRFLQRCADAGNAEASYTLGMIQFYCLKNYRTGAALMAKAAVRSHAQALYSLAIIQFNGSGSSKNLKDLTGGVTLCARAAYLGHVDAIRELGHCLKDGYGIAKNSAEGDRFLIAANARELAAMCSTPSPALIPSIRRNLVPFLLRASPSITGSPAIVPKCHPSNRFLASWNENRGADRGLRVCCYAACGRMETRMHEFRRCSVCNAMNYCSRGCQARDWTVGHNQVCRPMVRLENVDAGAGGM